MEKHKYSGKSKEEAIKKAQEELQELESNLFIREISETKAGLFKCKKVSLPRPIGTGQRYFGKD